MPERHWPAVMIEQTAGLPTKHHRLRARYQLAGLCIRCGKPRRPGNKLLCEYHVAYQAAAYQRSSQSTMHYRHRFRWPQYADRLRLPTTKPERPFNPFQCSETSARQHLEQLRWTRRTICPRCRGYRIAKLRAAHRAGLWRCRTCQHQFTVTTGTIFHRQHLSMKKLVLVLYVALLSEKTLRGREIQRLLGGSYKTSWQFKQKLHRYFRTESKK